MMRRMSTAELHRGQSNVPENRGSLTLLLGCMFSGKTSALLKIISESPIDSTLAIKHATDDRFDSHAIVSHAGVATDAVAIVGANDILNLIKTSTRLIALDEAHFFDAALPEIIRQLQSRAIDVVLTSLEPDSWGVPFPINNELRANADSCRLLTAVCARCGRDADHTQRLTPIVNGQMIVDPSNYEPRCRACWKPPIEVREASLESRSNFEPLIQTLAHTPGLRTRTASS